MTQLDTGLIVGAGLLVLAGVALIRRGVRIWNKTIIFCGVFIMLALGSMAYMAWQAGYVGAGR